MSAVMMTLINAPKIRVPERWRASGVFSCRRWPSPARDDRNNRGDDRKRDDRKRDDRKRDDFVRDGGSPWRTVSRAPGEETTEKADHGGISGKSFIDPEVLRRQRAEETRVYGENACQALFQSRPECIVRAWFIQSVTRALKKRCAGWRRTAKPTTWLTMPS